MFNQRTLTVASALVCSLFAACGAESPPDSSLNQFDSPAADLRRPTNLVAVAGDATVTLTWSQVPDAVAYGVKRSTTSGGPYELIDIAYASAYTDIAVTNGQTYYYVVSAGNYAEGETPSSNEASATPRGTVTPPPPPPPTGHGGDCGMLLASSPAAFCDTFDAPAGNGNRAGDLDGDFWGVSRTSQSVNFGQGMYNEWNPTTLETCNGPRKVLTPNDVIICNGQLREAVNDNNTLQHDAGIVTALAMYPKQPFDFAGRTGTVSFDVSNDSFGTHAAWPEFWLTDLPVPAPFIWNDEWQANPQHGFGIRFAGFAQAGQWGSCTNGDNLDKNRWTVDSVVVIRNYVQDDTNGYGPRQVQLTTRGCVTSPSGPNQMNHVELRVAQNKVEVWATDAGVAPSASTLKLIAEMTNANLTLTRGLIWIEDVHYNADKGPAGLPSQREHTFAWDNVAFDGPFTYRDFSYDALDNTSPAPNGAVNLGKFAGANQQTSWNVLDMPANRQAAVVRVLFNFYHYEVPSVLNVTVNGHAHPTPWPYPDNRTYGWRTAAVSIPISDLVTGTNVVQLGANLDTMYSNVNIVLVDVPNGVPVLPGNDNSYPN